MQRIQVGGTIGGEHRKQQMAEVRMRAQCITTVVA
jgi:hypothetical protein